MAKSLIFYLGVLILVILILFIPKYLVNASSESLPDSPFYSLKRFSENLQKFFTFDEIEKAKLELKFAKRRLKELEALNKKGDFSHTVELLQQSQRSFAHALELINYAQKKGKEVSDLMEELSEFSSNQQQKLEDIYAQFPEPIKKSFQSYISQFIILLKDSFNFIKNFDKSIFERLEKELERKYKLIKEAIEKGGSRECLFCKLAPK